MLVAGKEYGQALHMVVVFVGWVKSGMVMEIVEWVVV
jgi:hypothetical protein